MSMKPIEVPTYVADHFNLPFQHPSKESGAMGRSLERLYRLIAQALEGINWPDWDVANRKYHSAGDIEPYGFECVDGKFYIYIQERGQRKPVAIFKDDHLAAKYFVWLVSKGTRSINWELFLNMEP